jgi:GT2 family glycosyltransferase
MRASIIIASHNEGDLLANTIESCVETTAGMDYEIIVADDASSDGSAEAAARRFPMVRLYRQPRRQGASPTKHLGSRQARGEVLLFLDGHCKPEYDSLLRLVRAVEETDGQAVITPRILALDTASWKNIATQTGHGYGFDLRTMESRWLPLYELKKSSLGRGQFFESPALIGCAFAVSRLVYEKVWGFDPKMKFWGVEDLDFSLKCWLMGHPILHDPETAVGHRFQESFDHYSVPMEHIVVNELRLAYKNFTQAVWGAWLADGRIRHGGTLPENPEGLWAHAWELFKSEEDSARQERSYLQARRQRDEFWYAERFGLSWPRLMSSGRVLAAGASPSPAPSGGPSPKPSASPSPAPCQVTLALLNTGTVVAAPEDSTHDADVVAADGTDKLGQLPVGQGRSDAPFKGNSLVSPLMVIGTVIPAQKAFTFRWKRFLFSRSWFIRLNAAKTAWVVTQRGKVGPNTDDTGSSIFNSTVPSPQLKLYIYDNPGLMLGNDSVSKVGDFVRLEDDFLYQVQRNVGGTWQTCAQFHVGVLAIAKRKAVTGTVPNDWTGVECSSAIRTLNAVIDQTKVRAMVGGSLPIQINAAANA